MIGGAIGNIDGGDVDTSDKSNDADSLRVDSGEWIVYLRKVEWADVAAVSSPQINIEKCWSSIHK